MESISTGDIGDVQYCLEMEPQRLVIFLWTVILMRPVEERLFFPGISRVPSLTLVKTLPIVSWQSFHSTLLSR